MQLVDEHCAVFAFNNMIISSYRTGWTAPLIGVVKLLSPSSWLLIGLIGVAVAVFFLGAIKDVRKVKM